jgi:hypothetical protein
MSKLARVLALVVMSLAAMTAVAQAHAADRRRLLARERSSIPNGTSARLPSPMRPAETGGEAGWRIPPLGVLVAILALVAGVVAGAARHANPTRRAGQTG